MFPLKTIKSQSGKVVKMKEETKRVAEYFQCEFEVFEKGESPEALEEAYFKALEEGRENGFYPVMLLADERIAEWLEVMLKDGYDKESLISECSNNGKELLEEYLEEDMEEQTEEERAGFIGNETEGDVILHFCGYISFRAHELEEDTLLLKLPVKHPWEVIGWIPFGGWNECPSPEDMIAVCKYWYEEYGAMPAVIADDVMEFYAPKRLNGADSLKVAKEHFAFCSDRIYQGTRTNTLSELAAGLEDSEVWYFWWD